jgi:hypothetical protein
VEEGRPGQVLRARRVQHPEPGDGLPVYVPSANTRIGPNRTLPASNKNSDGKPFVYEELTGSGQQVLHDEESPLVTRQPTFWVLPRCLAWI